MADSRLWKTANAASGRRASQAACATVRRRFAAGRPYIAASTAPAKVKTSGRPRIMSDIAED
jgi:hypothetical protein